jgi:hypothetical protein
MQVVGWIEDAALRSNHMDPHVESTAAHHPNHWLTTSEHIYNPSAQ